MREEGQGAKLVSWQQETDHWDLQETAWSSRHSWVLATLEASQRHVWIHEQLGMGMCEANSSQSAFISVK